MTTTSIAPAWTDLWLAKGMPMQAVPGSSMIEIHGVRGFLMPGDVQYLWDLATDLPSGGIHVEIGSWMGLSSIVMANALIANLNFDARIHCIDTWQGSEEHRDVTEIRQGTLYETFLDNIEKAHVGHFVTPHRGDSATTADQFADGSVDSIFIDGDHSYEGCLRDIAAWLPKLKPGGRIGGHDATPGQGVERAAREMAQLHGLEVEFPPPAAHYVWQFRSRD